MKNRFAIVILLVLLTAGSGSSFTTPDVVFIRVTVDRDSPLSRELLSNYSVTGGGEGYLDLVVPRANLDELAKILPSYQVIYGSQQDKIEKTVGVDFEDTFHDYNEMVEILNQAAQDHPNIVKLQTLGLSVENRSIMGAKISDNPGVEEDEPEFRVVGLHHGDELMGTEINLRLLEYLTDNYGTDPFVTSLVDGMEIWIVPMMNPDGRMASPYPTRYNANGVDLNRDYGYMWNGITPSIFSQPETRAIRNHGIENNFMLSLSYHTSGDIVNYVWNYSATPTDDDEIVSQLSEEFGSFNGYWVVHGYYWYQTYGDCNDWSYGSRSDIDWTIEVANSNIDQVWNKNRDAILTLMDHADEGIRGIITDTETGEPIEAIVTVEELSYPWYNDPEIGDYHRLLLPGTYTVTYSSPGYSDTTIENIVVSGSTATVVNVALRPGGDNYASQVVSCYFYDPFSSPNQYLRNPTNANYALGYPDDISASLGEGGNIVLDFGKTHVIPNLEGDDFTVYEEDPPDGYSVFLGDNFLGPWTSLGTGYGTTSFDLDDAGFSTARYVRIVDDDDGDPTEWYPGCDIDAVVAVTLPDTVILAYSSHTMSDSAYGNSNGRIDPGETVEIDVTLRNIGTLEATGVSALLSSADPMISVDVETASYPNIPGGGEARSLTSYVISVSPDFPEGESATLDLEITASGGLTFESSFTILVGMKPVILIDDDAGEYFEQYFTFALDGAGYAYDIWEVSSQGSPSLDILSSYGTVIWTTGEDYSNTLSSADRANLASYLDAGGNLFLSSQDYLYDNGLDYFATDYLHVSWFDSDVGVTAITGIPGDPISDGLSYNLSYPAGFSNWSDDMLPDSEAAEVFLNSAYSARGGGLVDYYSVIRYPAEGPATFKTVFFAVPFEAVPQGEASITLMSRIMEWLQGDITAATLVLEPDTTVIGAGESLGIGVTVTNLLPYEDDFVFWTNVTLPAGGTYPPSGYLLGPWSASLDSLQTVSVHVSHRIPNATPRTTFTYNAFLTLGGDLVAEDHFDFDVVDP